MRAFNGDRERRNGHAEKSPVATAAEVVCKVYENVMGIALIWLLVCLGLGLNGIRKGPVRRWSNKMVDKGVCEERYYISDILLESKKNANMVCRYYTGHLLGIRYIVNRSKLAMQLRGVQIKNYVDLYMFILHITVPSTR